MYYDVELNDVKTYKHACYVTVCASDAREAVEEANKLHKRLQCMRGCKITQQGPIWEYNDIFPDSGEVTL